MVDAVLELHAVAKAGYAAGVTEHVPKLLGRRAIDLREFVKKNAAAWRA